VATYTGALGQVYSDPGSTLSTGAVGGAWAKSGFAHTEGGLGLYYALWGNVTMGAVGQQYALLGAPLVVDPSAVRAVRYLLRLEDPGTPGDYLQLPMASCQARYKESGVSTLDAKVPSAQRWADQIEDRITQDMVVYRREEYLDGSQALVEIARATLHTTTHTVQAKSSSSQLSSKTAFANGAPKNVQLPNTTEQQIDDQGTLVSKGAPNNGIGKQPGPDGNPVDKEILPKDQVTVSESVLPKTVKGTYPVREVQWRIGPDHSQVEIHCGSAL